MFFYSKFLLKSVGRTALVAFTLCSVAQGASTASNDAALVRRLEALRSNIEKTLLARSIVVAKEENFAIHGQVTGSINGRFIEHSPLSMLVMGALAGGLIGATGGAALSVPFLTGAGFVVPGAILGGTTGAVAGLFTPPGHRDVEGKLAGQLDGKGVKIFERPSLFGLVVLDPSVLAGLRKTVKENGDYDYSGCASTVTSLLTRIEQSPRTMSEVEAEQLVTLIGEFKVQLQGLRNAKVSAFDDPVRVTLIESYLKDYETWLETRRLSIVTIASLKPVFDLQKKAYVTMPDWLASDYGPSSGSFTKDVYTFHFWRKDPHYSEADFKREFAGARHAEMVTVNSVNILVPSIDSSGNFVRFTSGLDMGVIAPAGTGTDHPLVCTTNTVSDAIDFILRASESHDFYFSYPDQDMNLRAHF